MRVARLTVELAHRRVQLEVLDHAGQRAVALDPEATGRVLEAARSALSVLDLPKEPCNAITLDEVRGRLEFHADGGILTLVGADFDRHRPDLIGPLGRAAIAEARALEALQSPQTPAGLDHRHAGFWGVHYDAGRGPWDLGGAAPPLEHLLDRLGPPPRGGRAIVLGCGRGHDLRAAAHRGWAVTGVDFVESALEDGRAMARREGLEAHWICADILTLDTRPERYDLVLEHTCFCAIDPERRRDYARIARHILRPEGQLAGVFMNHGKPGGPPFDTPSSAIRECFEPSFDIHTLEKSPNSPSHREGSELIATMTRREFE